MILTLAQLTKIMPNLNKATAEEYLPFINAAMLEFQINTPLRAAAWLAQLAHESGELKIFTENLNYSANGLKSTFKKYFSNDAKATQYARKPEQIANCVYANRNGNGNESSGDGWKYRGRSPIQLTGKENYTEYGKKLNVDLVNNPDLAAQPEVGFRIAGAFWDNRNLNSYADKSDFKVITYRINGGYNHLDERTAYYKKALSVLK